ncbi:MAG TPA: GNAT family N-acetyltransferase [Candidatus Angelobacter sp.]|jgi:ribosomal protein S18 acetylase RimI-like enzyme|nr:GNAT family N-acetyltransferase [Candidatus Angelobacter sp.]
MHPLDNPTWAALTSHQGSFAIVEGMARRFPPEVCVHGALATTILPAWQSMARLARDPVALFSLRPPQFPTGFITTRQVELSEMLQEQPAEMKAPNDFEVVDLTAEDLPEMSALYEATRPGRRLSPRLYRLGGFLGVKDGGRVVAMGCLRLHLRGFREISTVGTLSGHEGRGFATAIVSELSRRIHAAGETPFLTVRTDNQRAADIYKRLGFKERTGMFSTTIKWEGA